MNLLKELLNTTLVTEGRMKDALDDLVHAAIAHADTKGHDYQAAVSAIATAARELDTHDLLATMSETDLRDFIEAQFSEEDLHEGFGNFDEELVESEEHGWCIVMKEWPNLFMEGPFADKAEAEEVRDDSYPKCVVQYGCQDGKKFKKEVKEDEESAASQPAGQQSTPPEDHEFDAPEPKLIGKAGEFSVEVVGDDQVQIMQGNQVRLSMPLVIWKQLIR
jgi:hypothetical protein